MIDVRPVREDPQAFHAAMVRRGRAAEDDAGAIVHADQMRRAALAELESNQARRNELSKIIGQARRDGRTASESEAEVAALKQAADAWTGKVATADAALFERLSALPNILDPDVPDGRDEAQNVVLKTHGDSRVGRDLRQHFELGETLGMDFASAAKVSGARFVVLWGALARLERALGQFMLDLHTTEHGYTETAVPVLVNAAAMRGTGQLPKFEDDLFRTTDGRYLIPTAEVPLTNLYANEILPVDRLPIRLAALTDCFRSEAGSAGRDTRGMLRQHQFKKVELVSIVRPDESDAEHERMTRCAETVLERLGLTYRRVLLCAGDTGFSAAKTYDIEVWLPGQGAWREISSCSNTRAFQARRMAARYRGPDGKPAFVHTLNGSGVAVGRCLIAVMETFQDAGAIDIPEALHPYMGGVTRLQP